eukprot:6865229-Prymnesium_polylepis.1
MRTRQLSYDELCIQELSGRRPEDAKADATSAGDWATAAHLAYHGMLADTSTADIKDGTAEDRLAALHERQNKNLREQMEDPTNAISSEHLMMFFSQGPKGSLSMVANAQAGGSPVVAQTEKLGERGND